MITPLSGGLARGLRDANGGPFRGVRFLLENVDAAQKGQPGYWAIGALRGAGGSGMAPILSMLADLAEKGNERPVTFLFGARREHDFYFQDRLESIRRRMPALETIFALSDEQPQGWRGETGLVTETLARRLPVLKNYDAYLCGPPGMIEAAIPLLIERGVRERNIYFDAFVPSGDR